MVPFKIRLKLQIQRKVKVNNKTIQAENNYKIFQRINQLWKKEIKENRLLKKYVQELIKQLLIFNLFF